MEPIQGWLEERRQVQACSLRGVGHHQGAQDQACWVMEGRHRRSACGTRGRAREAVTSAADPPGLRGPRTPSGQQALGRVTAPGSAGSERDTRATRRSRGTPDASAPGPDSSSGPFTSILNPNGRAPKDYWVCAFPEQAENKSYAFQLFFIVGAKAVEVGFGGGSGESRDPRRRAAGAATKSTGSRSSQTAIGGRCAVVGVP